MEYRMLTREELERVWTIDRRERIDNIYLLVEGELRLEPVNSDVPGWHPDNIRTTTTLLYESFDRGALFFAAFDGEAMAGVAVLGTLWWKTDLLQLEFLHVGRDYRGQGLGKKLFEQAADAARDIGARGLYISATPGENTIHFYQRRGSVLTTPDPELYALEPDDIHLECPV